MSRFGKFLLILVIPVALYGAAKGLLYYKAKSAVDDIVVSASNHAEVRYEDISTDLGGAVTVSQITVKPHGQADIFGIDAVRISSDDPMFFIRGAQFQPGQNAPPPRLAFDIVGIKVPLAAEILRKPPPLMPKQGAAANPCSEGLNLDPELLQQIGFAELEMDVNGFYRLDEDRKSLEAGMEIEVRDIQTISVDLALADVDVEALNAGAAPQVSFDAMGISVRVDPAFGRKALKTCALGSDQPLEEWSDYLADRSVAEFAKQGLVLGGGLTRAVREFHRDWGEFRIEARPSQPVGLLSLMFLPPDQLASVLGLRMLLNDQPIADTSFEWQQPDQAQLGNLFGVGPTEDAVSNAPAQPSRILVRRSYESVAVANIAGYVDHKVRVKPRGQPQREGVLKRIVSGEAEIEQTLHGGKYTVYVPVAQIESMQALTQREITN